MNDEIKRDILGVSPAAVGSVVRHIITLTAGMGVTIVSVDKTDAVVQMVVYIVSAVMTMLTLLWSGAAKQKIAIKAANTAIADAGELIQRGENALSASRIGPTNGGNVAPMLAMCMMLGVLMVLVGGCASNQGTVGQTFTQGDNARELRNGGPITLAVDTPTGAVTDANGGAVLDKDGKPVVPVESVSTSSTGPGGYVLADSKQSRALLNNTVVRNIAFAKDPDGKVIFNSVSGTDVRATAESLSFNPATGQLEGKNLKFETLASAPFDASNASLVAWKEAFQQQTQAQRDAAIAQINATADLLKSTVPSVAGELTKIAQFLVAP